MLLLAVGCTPPGRDSSGDAAPEQRLLVPLDLRDAELTQAVAGIGEAIQRPILVDQAAGEVASCARLTLYVPLGTPRAIAEASLATALSEQGLHLREEDEALVVAVDKDKKLSALCQRQLQQALRATTPSTSPRDLVGLARAPRRSTDLSDPFAQQESGPVGESASVDLKDPFAGRDEPSPAPALEVVMVDDTHYEITRSSLEEMDPNAWIKQARVIPSLQGGITVGFKIYGIRSGSIPNQLGLRNGDLVVSIAGVELKSVDAAIQALAAVHDAKSIAVVIERRGERMTTNYKLI